MINNLAQLKRVLVRGTKFQFLKHRIEEFIGQQRVVNIANTVGIYSVIPNEPNHKVSLANDRKGYYTEWGKASDWEFDGDLCFLYFRGKEHVDENLILAIKIINQDEIEEYSKVS